MHSVNNLLYIHGVDRLIDVISGFVNKVEKENNKKKHSNVDQVKGVRDLLDTD